MFVSSGFSTDNNLNFCLNLPSTEQAVKTKPKQVFFFHFSSFLTVYLLFVRTYCDLSDNYNIAYYKVSFCGLIKGISPKFCLLCVRVKINKRSLDLFVFGSYFLHPQYPTEGLYLFAAWSHLAPNR